ncbi:MAG: ABC transporter permease [Alphaproteobacteria bacterium]|nr:ABC transporter permease [Alphaproteobacteria bacterium]
MSRNNSKSSSAPSASVIRPIHIGLINWVGLTTLYKREVMRFVKILGQTVAAPVITTWLFLTIFAVAIGDRVDVMGDMSLLTFLAPGLIMMTVLQNAFANTSSSLVIGKVQGNIVDLIMPPMSAYELFLGMVAAGITRGLMVAIAAILTLPLLGINIIPANIFAALAFLLLGGGIMAVIGLIAGIWADKFDSLATITNFVIQPLVFLSGTFYTIDRLPEPIAFIAYFNPIFYMIDGFRYAMTGFSSASPLWGGLILSLTMLFLSGLGMYLLKTGYKLKS